MQWTSVIIYCKHSKCTHAYCRTCAFQQMYLTFSFISEPTSTQIEHTLQQNTVMNALDLGANQHSANWRFGSSYRWPLTLLCGAMRSGKMYWRFRVSCYLHHQGRGLPDWEVTSQEKAKYCVLRKQGELLNYAVCCPEIEINVN